MSGKIEGVRKIWDRYKYVGLVVLIGVGLLLWPGGEESADVLEQKAVSTAETTVLETQLADMLGTMSGVGQARVMLTVDSDGERQLAQDTDLSYRGDTASPEDYSRSTETVLVDGDSGDTVMVVRTVYPTYRGALVVCQGGGRAEVRLAVTQAVSVLTGLTADRITVAEWQ